MFFFLIFLYLYLIPRRRSGTKRCSSISLFPIHPVPAFFLPSCLPLFKCPHTSLLSGKALRWQPWTCSRWLYLSLFAQKPEQHWNGENENTGCHSIRIPMLQITHVHMVASHRLSDTQNASLIFTHTFPLHTPVINVLCFIFPAVKQCDRSPCGRGATCQEAPGGYKCLCPPGWTGRTCQLGQFYIYYRPININVGSLNYRAWYVSFSINCLHEYIKTQREYAFRLNK